MVSLPHGFGHELPGVRLSVAAEKPGANLNALLPLGADLLGGLVAGAVVLLGVTGVQRLLGRRAA